MAKALPTLVEVRYQARRKSLGERIIALPASIEVLDGIDGRKWFYVPLADKVLGFDEFMAINGYSPIPYGCEEQQLTCKPKEA